MLPAGWSDRSDGGSDRGRRLAPLTSWRIGGPAEWYFEPASVEAVAKLLAHLRRIGAPWRILGGGTNLLVPDRGVEGAVVSLNRMRTIERRGDGVVAEAGVRLAQVVRFAAAHGLSGAEPLAGIPGRVGGAVFGNAGGRHGAIGALVRSIDLLEPDGTLVTVVPDEGFFRYRASAVGARLVLRVHLELAPDEAHAVRRRSLDLIRERRRTQPGWVGNAGCVFKNAPGASAGWLIDSSGAKESRVGGIRVSPIHANFFENTGDGTSDDVLRLVDRVRERVRRIHDVDLEMEVRRWT